MDDAGNAVHGARVFAIDNSDYICTDEEERLLISGTTRADGKFELTQPQRIDGGGLQDLSYCEMFLIASAPQHPLAFQIIRDTADPQRVTLAAHGGGLEIAVLKQGKPVICGRVQLVPVDLREQLFPLQMGCSIELQNLVKPVVRTDQHGIACFANLAPGNYRVVSIEGHDEQMRVPNDSVAYEAHNVSVVAGKVSRFSLSIYNHSLQTLLRVTGLTTPLDANRKKMVVIERVKKSQWGGASFISLSEHGEGSWSLWCPGLWHIQIKSRAGALRAPLHEKPYQLAEAWIAVSSAYAAETVDIVMRHVDESNDPLQLPREVNIPTHELLADEAQASDFTAYEHYRFSPSIDNGQKFVSGQVFCPDGTTPAYACQIVTFGVFYWDMTEAAISDPHGRFETHPTSCSGVLPEQEVAGSPNLPVAVAYLPGAFGATIVPLSHDTRGLRIVLPAAISLSGRVTLGGNATADCRSKFRVYAEYQGKGKLTAVLSVETIAQADGTFELNGLTPGPYRLQAAMDDIWLSNTLEFEAVQDSNYKDVMLEIAPPGVPMLLTLTASNTPCMPETKVFLDRPAGPLRDRFWPEYLTTDGAGKVWLDGLETGEHTLTVHGEKYKFQIPAADERRIPIEAKLVLI